MTLTEKEIRKQLHYHIKRKLKILGGHGQISVRRLGKSIYAKNGRGTQYETEPTHTQRQQIYRIACELCEEYGGKEWGHTYRRYKKGYDKVSRLYQF